MGSISPEHSNRTRSPSPTEQPARRGPSLSHEPCQTPCGCRASLEVRRLEARVAELEAELQRKTALLTDDFHDDPDIQQLRHRVEPDGDITYAAAALRQAWRERISDAFVVRVRDLLRADEANSYFVDPALTASWCVHAVVPHLVSSSVVMLFLKPDVVVVGASGIAATICANAPALVQLDALEKFLADAQAQAVDLNAHPRLPGRAVLRDLCAARLPQSGLTRLLAVLDLMGGRWPAVPLFRIWCRFRLGQLSSAEFLSVFPSTVLDPDVLAVFRSDVAAEEFLLPAAPLCTLHDIDSFSCFIHYACPSTIATVEFRDGFFTRLANAPGINEGKMFVLSTTLVHTLNNANVRQAAVFFEPQFALDWAVHGLAFCRSAPQHRLILQLCDVVVLSAFEKTWPTPLLRSLRDAFLIPAASITLFEVAWSLGWCLSDITDGSTWAAALFCTADFRDRFFISLFRRDGEVAADTAEAVGAALTNITAAVPRSQRQAVFATEEFRDVVLMRLVPCARGDADAIALVRAAFLNIAENEDGSLHDVFMGDACRASILEPLQSERSGSLTSAQLFENIQDARSKEESGASSDDSG